MQQEDSLKKKKSDELLRELADREAIRDLAVRYMDCLWREDVDGLVSLFTADGTFTAKDAEDEVVSNGRDELKKMCQRAFSQVHPRHFIHTHVLELRDVNKATGRCYVELRSATDGMAWLGSGYYEDEYVKAGEEWKFASRRFVEMEKAIPLRAFMGRHRSTGA